MLLTKGPSEGLAIALIEKAGCTSIQQTIKAHRFGRRLTMPDLRQHQYPLRIYLRHPLERFVSAWRFFRPSMFPRESGIPQGAGIEQFTDDVLRGVENEHWNPQLAMYEGCNIAEIFQFERLAETWDDIMPKPVRHLNASYWKKPELTYRVDELRHHYAEDLAQWESSSEISKQSAADTPS